ncbi:glycosyltransferase family 4 protein [Roseimicrobium sp. ORNL1]|uniref:glycosyltransferase family 4 protein n=1 Tax=Roseimicrobium sp. ORNL1 TaxID=2711231 RepID=UPI0013E0FAD6|nr:glycosyltransferase family 4 protein [Roseimicrobium sp. ORNL1]QIF05717.1 glycosyltransferase family 4 protein [Roseimicrobium sp. ORNL1]
MNTPINHVSADVSPTLRSQAAGQIMASGSGVNALAATTMQKAPATKSRKKASTVTAERLQAMASVRTTPAKGRLLWVGDATVPTGFATVTHSVLQHLHQDWEVFVSGVNYNGGDHDYPYPILPAWQGGDMWGMNRFSALCEEIAPDVAIINNDWWNVAAFLDHAPKNVPILGYMPVDGAHLDPTEIRRLEGLSEAVWYTDFGYQEAVQAGFTGARHVIPHGLDGRLWQSKEKAAARARLGLNLPEDAFIVGNVNRNQPRKRLDVTIRLFAHWTKTHDIKNAWLLLHCAKKDTGWNLERVANFYGVADRLILTGPQELHQAGDTSQLQDTYNALDVQVSTTLGEGWGLTTMEGMACGIPQIVPDWAALGEWTGPAIKVPCTTELVHPEINTVGALPDETLFVEQLQALYADAALRERLSRAGSAHVRQPQFAWSAVARRFESLMLAAMQRGAAVISQSRTSSLVPAASL